MFEFLRKGASSVFAKIFLAIIVIVFIFWGIGNFTFDRSQTVAEAEGIKITQKEFREYLNYQTFQAKLAFGEKAQELLKDPKFKESTLQDLIRKKLFLKKVEELGLTVGNKEVEIYLSQIPAFQEQGVFSQAKYQAFLREIGITPKFFENLLRYDLAEQKFAYLTSSLLLVTKNEVEDFANFYFQKLRFQVATLPLKTCIAELKPSDKDLENYYLTKSNLYVEEEKVKLLYYFLPYTQEVEVNEKELKDYYQANLSKFKEAFKVKAWKIFIPGKGKDSFLKSQSIRSELKDLSDFKKFGGNSGWLKGEELPTNLLNLLRVAKKGTILGPLEVEGGYLILGVEEVNPERLLKFEEAKPRILAEVKMEKAKSLTLARANELYTKVVREDGLANLSAKEKIELKETPYLTKPEIYNLLQDSQTVDRIFKERKGTYFPPVATSQGVSLIEIKDKQEKRQLSFSEAKERVYRDYLQDKGKDLCEDKAKVLISEVRKGKNFLALAQQKGFILKESLLTRKDLPPNLGLGSTLRPGIIEQPWWEGENLVVFYLLKIEPASNLTSEDLNLAKDALLSLKKDLWQREILGKIAEGKIKIYPAFNQL